MTDAYYKGLQLTVARVDGRRHLPDVLAGVACGKLHPEHVTHRVARFAEAGEVMTDAGPKLVFVR